MTTYVWVLVCTHNGKVNHVSAYDKELSALNALFHANQYCSDNHQIVCTEVSDSGMVQVYNRPEDN